MSFHLLSSIILCSISESTGNPSQVSRQLAVVQIAGLVQSQAKCQPDPSARAVPRTLQLRAFALFNVSTLTSTGTFYSAFPEKPSMLTLPYPRYRLAHPAPQSDRHITYFRLCTAGLWQGCMVCQVSILHQCQSADCHSHGRQVPRYSVKGGQG